MGNAEVDDSEFYRLLGKRTERGTLSTDSLTGKKRSKEKGGEHSTRGTSSMQYRGQELALKQFNDLVCHSPCFRSLESQRTHPSNYKPSLRSRIQDTGD